MTGETEIIAAARRAEQYALEGETAAFTEACFALNAAMRERESLSPEEVVAVEDLGAASLSCDVATHLIRAADALCFIQKPMAASALLGGALAEPGLSRVKALVDRRKQLADALRHANGFSYFKELHATTDPGSCDLDQPRVKAELAAARRFLSKRDLERRDSPPRVLSVGCGYGIQERALLEEFPTMSMVVVDLSGKASGLVSDFPDRVTAFDPEDRYALPRETDGYDLVICFNALQQQPNVRGLLAFLHEQAAAGVYSVPEALKLALTRDFTDPPYINLTGFCQKSLENAFAMVGIESTTTQKTEDGFLVLCTEAV